jgi:protein-ribulosamine 3-kinase
MLPPEIGQYIENWLQREMSPGSGINSCIPSGGGSINHAFRLETGSGNFFIKYNSAHLFPGMFECEAKGLVLLKKSGCIQVPEVLHQAATGQYSFLLLSYIDSSEPHNSFWQMFGRQLAALHRNSSVVFGLDHDNYIGSLNQSNHQHTSWTEFLISERLEPQLKMAIDSGLLNSSDARRLNNFFGKLPGIIPQEQPALLHGDLWSGNFMTGGDGLPCIFDPAVYYGHRETDIGMTRLFGGFPLVFYDAYQDAFPMEKGWEARIGYNQLYPLLVHVNLFGSAYVSRVRVITSIF